MSHRIVERGMREIEDESQKHRGNLLRSELNEPSPVNGEQSPGHCWRLNRSRIAGATEPTYGAPFERECPVECTFNNGRRAVSKIPWSERERKGVLLLLMVVKSCRTSHLASQVNMAG